MHQAATEREESGGDLLALFCRRGREKESDRDNKQNDICMIWATVIATVTATATVTVTLKNNEVEVTVTVRTPLTNRIFPI